uniref:hydroxymethylbilane synthase n=1 Tax=Nonomuraea jabiensis TaxID=882448 RepID=UPI003D74C551
MIDGFPRQRGLLRLGGAPHLPLQALADELRSLTGRDVQPVPAEPVSLPGGAAARVPALRAQLAAGDIDCAVHALAELPTTPEPQLAIAATPTRDDPRDVLLASRPLRELVRGTVVGTASARRLAMLRRLRPDLTYHLIDGDAQLCMDMLADGHLAAVVCARLDLGRRKINVGQVFGIEQVLPDPGQGALVLECPNDRYDVIDTVRVLHDLRTWRAISAER